MRRYTDIARVVLHLTNVEGTEGLDSNISLTVVETELSQLRDVSCTLRLFPKAGILLNDLRMGNFFLVRQYEVHWTNISRIAMTAYREQPSTADSSNSHFISITTDDNKKRGHA